MFEAIGWRIYINATTKEKARIVLKRFEQVSGKMEVSSFKQYWKDESLFEIECKSIFQVEETEKAIFNVLILVNQLGHDIDVIGPLIYENKQTSFEGNCTRPSIVGVKWFHFYTVNFKKINFRYLTNGCLILNKYKQ